MIFMAVMLGVLFAYKLGTGHGEEQALEDMQFSLEQFRRQLPLEFKIQYVRELEKFADKCLEIESD